MDTDKHIRYVIKTEDRFSSLELSRRFEELVQSADKKYDRITFVCIGTDRSTGDSFGPLVGYMMSRFAKDYKVYGTLKDPVHAKNLDTILAEIDYSRELVVAVDASLGDTKHIGSIVLSNRPIKPGSGVGKNCTPVGDISISGIVNMAGFAPGLLLQCTRLYSVHQMAEAVYWGVSSYFFRQKNQAAIEEMK
ncbi:MAG: spore protease YyaC [Bacillota bacterium]